MGLLPAFRRQGIGKRLIQRALAAARDFGLRRVELTVRENNANAIALYRRVGFASRACSATPSCQWRL